MNDDLASRGSAWLLVATSENGVEEVKLEECYLDNYPTLGPKAGEDYLLDEKDPASKRTIVYVLRGDPLNFVEAQIDFAEYFGGDKQHFKYQVLGPALNRLFAAVKQHYKPD